LGRFNDIKNSVNGFNMDIHNFQDNEIKEKVSAYLTEYGFDITYDVNKTPPSPNTIILPNLLTHLKSHWYEKTEFELMEWEDKQLRIKGEVIASFSNDDEKKT
jgi:hypothetical protein